MGKMKAALQTIWHLPRNLMIGLIWLYQQTLSPDHGPLKHLYDYGVCKHEPTCSKYGQQMLQERGFIIGVLLSIKRVLSCNPWATSTRHIAEKY